MINYHNFYFAKFKTPVSSVYEIIFTTVIFALIPGILEELLLRGMLFEEYSGMGILVPVMLSSALGAILHFELSLFIVYFATGLAFAMIRALCRSVYYSIVAHALFNLLVIIIEPYIWAFLSRAERKAWFWIIILAFFFLFAFFTVSALQSFFKKHGALSENSIGRENLPVIFSSPYFFFTMSAFIVFSIVRAVLY